MKEVDVLELVQLAESNGIKIWLDGGWGVDALLGSQTRDHNDVDVIVQTKDSVTLQNLLEREGYSKQPDGEAWNFVLKHPDGREIDVHVITIDENGAGLYSPEEAYPANSLNATGTVGGVMVHCLTADYQVKSHTGYQDDENDYKDVQALCDTFDLYLPDQYKKWESNS